MNIDQAFVILMGFEGGLVNNPNDKGGLTKYGISKSAYPDLDIENLTEDHAKAIYATDYWLKGNCQKLKDELQYVHFDTCVNCGIVTAVRILQEASGAEVDGDFGSETLTKSDNVSIERYLLLREWYDDTIVEHRQDQIIFLGGWENRNKAILKLHDNKQI